MSDQSSARAPESDEPMFTHRQILYVVLGLLMGIFLVAMDQTVVSTAIRVIADDFGDYSQQAWVTTAYLVTSTIVTPLFGKLSDIFGRKPSYLFAVTLFLLGSLACSFSGSMVQLAAFRAVQGIGAGGLSVLSFTILGEMVPPRQRARYQGYFLAVFTGSSVLGPLVGGLFSNAESIAGISGWRWVFLINVPLSLVAMVVIYRVVNLPSAGRKDVRIDWLGSAVLTIALIPLLVVAEFGQQWGWAAPLSVGCIVISVVGIGAFVWIEHRMGTDALLPLHIFGNVRFSQGALLATLLGALMISTFSLVPQYFQVVLGANPTRAGTLLLPVIAGTIVGALVSGQIIARTGTYRRHMVVSAVVTMAGMFLMFVLSASADLRIVLPVTFVLGVGLGCVSQPITVTMQNILPARFIGISTAVATFFRQIGGTIGVAFFLSLWFAIAPSDITTNVSDALGSPAFRHELVRAATGLADPGARQLVSALNSGNIGAARDVVNNTAVLQVLPSSIEEPFRQAFASSLGVVFLVAAAVSLLGLVVLVCWKPVPLRTAGAAQEAAKKSAASDQAPETNRPGGSARA